MSETPKFSILMSNYNNERCVAEAIESVIKQTISDWELIIIDDGSSDNSLEIIKRYLKDIRIRLFVNEKNIGCIKTLKRMTRKVNSGLVGILDSDDALEKSAIEKMLDVFGKYPECGFVYSRYVYCDEDLNFIKDGVDGFMPRGKNNIHFTYSNAFRSYRMNKYYKTSGYDEKMLHAEDMDIILKLEEVTKFYFIDEVLYRYRFVKNSQTNNYVTGLIGKISHINARYKAYKRRIGTRIPNLTKKQISAHLIDAIFFCLKLKKYKRAREFFYIAMGIHPHSVSSCFLIIVRFFKFIPYRLFLFVRNKFFD